ncbi:leucyl aminopeptidase [Intrasporangium oryzae NRRL B-24470]|uniref:Probable cytosol aminopeptidase n=1 Tax=Intrasporangium oryzae NRRL B-24470 TaxID=1386089 RepID=W9G8Q1_9MICO|nr:leucyl aminopeptidase [Intrasporangium oryzae]EWT02430.1 leucyl aminopeptidase [Intrasporangium oryzae NRRL B-24470]
MSTPATLAIDPIPSWRRPVSVTVAPDLPPLAEAGATAVPVAEGADAPAALGFDRAALAAAGFEGKRGQTLVVPSAEGRALVAVGIGAGQTVDASLVRDLAASFALAVPHQRHLAVSLPSTETALSPGDFAEAVTEGVLLARWRFHVGKGGDEPLLESLVVVAPDAVADEVREGVRRGQVLARASNLGRDLANCPAAILTATRIAHVAEEIGPGVGLEVEVFDKAQLVEMGCGGLLGVNLGSVEEPRMIRLRYVPAEPKGHLALVGKGIMYDSGGISLKPSDESHAQMKNDMTGAATVLASMTALEALGCTTEVTGYLMCTDNMPSGSALKLGDVLTMRNGLTVEVLNTDAEGRLVMADALALAAEQGVDAIVDIATLTGACLRTFGVDLAGVMGNSQELVDQVTHAGTTVDEPVWQLPLHRPYRKQLDSAVADLTNMGGPNAGSITAALFLEEFVDGRPWAHIDIAGTAQLPAASTWHNKGATGFGSRLLVELALRFTPPPAVEGSSAGGNA